TLAPAAFPARPRAAFRVRNWRSLGWSEGSSKRPTAATSCSIQRSREDRRAFTVSDLRWHPLLREWVTVAPARQDRTYHPDTAHCPLCPTRPGMPETEIPEPDYHIAVFENRFPSYDEGQGRCEVVCYTPVHESSLGAQSVAHIRDLVEVWQDRYRELSALPEVKYVFIFENRGEEIGVTLHHPHGQIYAYP